MEKKEDTSLLAILKSHPDDYKMAAVKLGRSIISCKQRINMLLLSYSEVGMLDFTDPDDMGDDRVPEELRIRSIVQNESESIVFSEAAKHGPVFHLSHVSPFNMDPLNQVRYELFSKTSFNDEDRRYLLDLLSQEKKCLLPDSILRDHHDFDIQNIPHVMDPTSLKFHEKKYDKVYVSSSLRHAALKFRKATDRAKYYDEGCPYGNHAYLYIIRKEECMLAGVRDCGFTFGEQHSSHDYLGKTTLPVCYSACYKVTWNGDGYANATFEWIPLS
jgi:hypothetical protein